MAEEIEAWFRQTAPENTNVLLAGDVISIRVQGKAEYDITRTIPPSGVVPLYRADKPSVNALDRTPLELEAAVAAAYAGKIEDPYVTVFIERAVERSIFIRGAVNAERRYAFSGAEPLTVSEAISLADGGNENADLHNVIIIRFHPEVGSRVVSPPLNIRAVDAGDLTDDLYVLPGDTVSVPDAVAQRVHLLGHVVNAGAVVWYDGLTLSMAITERGGFQKYARLSRISIIRKGRSAIEFDFEKVLSGEEDDLFLLPGDRVFIPESPL